MIFESESVKCDNILKIKISFNFNVVKFDLLMKYVISDLLSRQILIKYFYL